MRIIWIKFGYAVVSLFLGCTAIADATTSSLYLCAKELTQIHANTGKTDVLYSEEKIIFTSIMRLVPGSLAMERRLLVMTISGLYEYVLPTSKEVMVRVDVPHSDPRRGDLKYYFRYWHGEASQRRTSLFTVSIPEVGFNDSSYMRLKKVTTDSITNKKSIMSLIDQKIRWIEKLVMAYKLPKKNLVYGNLSLCKNIAANRTILSRRIGDFAFRLEGLSPFMQVRKMKSASRMPASL